MYGDLRTLAGLPKVHYPPAQGIRPDDPASVAWQLAVDYDEDEEFERHLAALFAEEWAPRITALVIGNWGEAYGSQPPIGPIADAAPRLAGLRALFIGDLVSEESEISWITQGDVTPVLAAYPQLEVLGIRGANGLGFTPVRHEHLRSLTVESGGLGGHVVNSIGECEFPALTELELWLGVEDYGGDATVDDLRQILTGRNLPALKTLRLRNSVIADAIAAALAAAPVVARLEEMDLSMGMLSDVGAGALLAGQPLSHLRRLDLQHHYISEPLLEQLRAELGAAGVELDLSDPGDPDDPDDFYVEVSE